ncbi:Imm8 family immunity protein [Microvirga terricola]|uniref:Immunity protein 8 n=1 Tax=Microvirga terricola TaxID=2719797 RepID=A0ABX0VCG4_9HYPH|nr:Imm8 family immunity protein [Microvirga terricola]NIX77362.1 hypothetical protein [Microvirga terricola]
MKAQLKDIFSPDVELETYSPPDRRDFAIFVQLFVGPEGADGADTFNSCICSPGKIAELVARKGYIIADPLLIFEEYDLQKIKEVINTYCQSCSGENWPELVPKLLRLGRWEFEDYRPYRK